LDFEGHLKLTDFGFAKVVTTKTYTLCGTPEYLAPEIILNRGHDRCADWWTLGVIIFEFLSGSPPFYDESRNKVYEKILTNKIEWPRHFDSAAKDIIKKLLVNDPTKRLGSGNCGIIVPKQAVEQTAAEETPLKGSHESSNASSFSTLPVLPSESIFLTQPDLDSEKKPRHVASAVGPKKDAATKFTSIINQIQINKSLIGSEEIKTHRWFISITDWNDVYERRLKPPFRPEVLHEGDTRNFEKYDTPDLSKAPIINDKQLDAFINF
jgi:serine/threonine protein kinase